MADLTDLQAAQTVKIAGANPSTGGETNFMDVDSNGRPTVNALLKDASGTAINLGQTTMSASVPVVIASNQSTLPISAASLPLPTGAATEATLAKLPLAQGSATTSQSGILAQGAVTTAAPTYTTAQTSPLSLTTAGALRTDSSAVTQPISAAALPLPTGAATSANQTTEITALQLIDDLPHAQNASLSKGVPVMGQLDDTSTTAATEDAVAVARITAQRALHVNVRDNSGTELGTTTTPFVISGPAANGAGLSGRPVRIAYSDGANIRDALSDASGRAIIAGAGTAGSPVGGVLSIQGVASGIAVPISAASLPLPTGAATETTLSAINIKLPAALGQTTMSASLAVVLASNQSPIPVSTYDTGPANGTILALDTGTSSLVGSNGQVFYFSTPTVNSAATFSLASIENVIVQANILGGGGTLVVDVSMDGGTFWLRPNVYQISTQNYTNGFTAPFVALVNTAGMTHIRVRATVSWAGTGTIIVRETINSRAITIGDSLPAGANVIGSVTQSGVWTVTAIEDKNYGTVGATTLRVASQIGNATGAADFNAGATGAQTLRVAANQGAPALIANAWFMKITDNTDVAKVRAASSAAAASDPALVVSLSPNSPLPTGTNDLGSVKAELRDDSGAAITLGQKTKANSVPVVLPSDQTITVSATPLPPSGSGFSFGDVATSSTAQAPVERTTYTEQTANSTMSIASSSANDTAAGTGARTVIITYFDNTMAGPLTTTATLNGTTFVNLVAGMCYIEKMVVATVGSTGSNVGILTLKATTAGGGATVGTIGATANQTFWAHHYVATSKICYISGFTISNNQTTAGNGGVFLLGKSTPTVANTPTAMQISDFHTLSGSNPGSQSRTYLSPIQVVGPAKVTAYVLPLAGTAMTMRASFDYIDN